VRLRFLPLIGAPIALGFLLVGLLSTPRPSQAMPTFAQAYGMKCSVCHTMVPLLNAYGRYVQRTGYAALDRNVLARALRFWAEESVNEDSSAGAGTGTPRYATGNLAVHASGYLAPDVTMHIQQWIVQNNQPGGIDTLWFAYNNILHRDGHLFVGKIENPAPSPYSQTMDIDGPSASETVVGEHDWGATYNNRWGTKLAYVRNSVSVEGGYLLSSEDLSGLGNFNAGDKTFQWKAAYAPSDHPIEAGFFGSSGSLPVSTGTDHYNSLATYVQRDPGSHGVPGLLAIYQTEQDNNPGIDAASSSVMPATTSRGVSTELYEPFLHGGAVLSFRHDFNNDGFGTLSNGNSVNLGFNVPRFQYLHGYLESNLGGNSALVGASGGPTWKGMLWLTIPLRSVK
jgi:hypothetical protein